MRKKDQEAADRKGGRDEHGGVQIWQQSDENPAEYHRRDVRAIPAKLGEPTRRTCVHSRKSTLAAVEIYQIDQNDKKDPACRYQVSLIQKRDHRQRSPIV